jgi:hypothetical protein
MGDFIHIIIPENKMKIFAAHIGYLIQWILNTSTPTTINISIQVPDQSSINQYVTKISYKNYNVHRFTALSDIDTKPIPDFLMHYYQNPNNYESIIIPLSGYGINQYVMYRTLSIIPLLDEKIYYFILYYNTLDQKNNGIDIEDEELKKYTIDSLEFVLDKFQRSIYALTRAIAVKMYYSRLNTTMSKSETNPEGKFIALQGNFLNQHFLIKSVKPDLYRVGMVKRIMKIA